MASKIWSLRRYTLPAYNKKALSSKIISWVKDRQGKIKKEDVLTLFSKFKETRFVIADSGFLPMAFRQTSYSDVNLHIVHDESILYVYTRKGEYPDRFGRLQEEIIEPFVLDYGGSILDEQEQLIDTSSRSVRESLLGSNHVHTVYQKHYAIKGSESKPATPIQRPSTSPTTPNVNIRLEPQTEKAQSITEEVTVPRGVNITVKRSRTIEHTVNVNWGTSGGGGLDLGLKPVISASIKGAIEQKQGRSYQESETIEYEIALNGEVSTHYRLIWRDVWRRGVAEVREGRKVNVYPFQFREWAELEVLPI
jgi:hypothetical protein